MQGIYRSNLMCPDLQSHFICQERKGPHDHTVLFDPNFSGVCNFCTHDEAAILHNIALACPGDWIEIGSHTGWSGAHIAAARCAVIGLEPEAVPGSLFRERAVGNVSRCGVDMRFLEMTSKQYFEDDAIAVPALSGAFIDGNHDTPEPLLDAQRVVGHLRKDAGVIVFHDFVGMPIQNAVRWLIEQGFNFRVYNTPQMIAACWRGALTMPVHTPDPTIPWGAVRRSTGFDFEGES